MPLVFLVGFMGAGKSHWGKLLALSTGADFIELDHEIEIRAGQSIVEIFENRSESFFRELESQKLRELSHRKNCVVATGGGTPCFHHNMEWMNAHGETVFLQAPVSYLVDRIKTEKNHRPLIKDLNEEALVLFVKQKLKEREAYYLESKFIIDHDELSTSGLSLLVSKLKSV